MDRHGWRVARLDLWIDDAFDERLGREPGIAVHVGSARAMPDATWQVLERADVYHVSSAKDELPPHWFVNETLLSRCPSLLCVSAGGAGYDTVDVDACTRAGVLVVNQSGANAASVAEHTFGLMLAVSRRIVESHWRLRTDTVQNREELMGTELAGKTLGLVGLGAIGTRAARIAHGFDLRVLGCDPLLTPAQIRERGAEPCDMDTLLQQSDVVSLHCPLNSETRGMFGREAFLRMKRGAIFISTARGGIHDETALLAALRQGHLGGAGLDVWEVEPPAHDAPLLALPKVVATYHTAGVTHEARRRLALMAAEQIVMLLRGHHPPRIVNPQAWPGFQARLAARAAA